MSNEQILSIADLTKFIKRTFDNNQLLQNVWVRGEISNFKKHSRGHMYFTIKDSQSRIQAVMFAGNNRFLKFIPEDGLNVLVRGSVTVYEPNGQYQMYVNELQLDGVGNLFLAYEQLKQRLEQAGYFDEAIKKKLPKIPANIGVITSPTGAAIRDIVTTLKRRFPIAKITLFPVLVQGEAAAQSIAKAITQANQCQFLDVLIIGRGGGSIEELWAFNEQIVASAIYESTIPIVSAVGHETDFTIADFIADVRAATPTAAAELVVPHIEELLERVNQRKLRLQRVIRERVLTERKHLANIQKSYAFRYPEQLFKQKEQELDRLMELLQRNLQSLYEKKQSRLEKVQRDLMSNHPKILVDKEKERLMRGATALRQHLSTLKREREHQFSQFVTKLEALSPLKVMDRGYSLSYKEEDGTLIKSITQVRTNEEIVIKLMDGSIYCDVKRLEVKA